MANYQVDTVWKLVDKRHTINETNTPYSATFNTNTEDVYTMRTRLLAIGGVYTNAYLDKMTRNDMLYAIRLADEPTSI
jgi:hypothetical protein